VLGARSLVGAPLVSRLEAASYRVVAFTRAEPSASRGEVRWRQLPSVGSTEPISDWISVVPIWTLAEHFDLLSASGARRLVALSSTSRYTKEHSSDPAERALAEQLTAGEQRVQAFATEHGIAITTLRPTLIYGFGRDRNICAVARFIHRYGCFPLIGGGVGLRQPVHAREVAAACLLALRSGAAFDRGYEISGGETLSYREMVCRVFAALDRRPRFAAIPQALARLAARMAGLLPGRRQFSVGVIERMTQDLVFEHGEAARDFGYSPGSFVITAADLPSFGAVRD
jgi:nucleoside-diphosphate-sugar epimerase